MDLNARVDVYCGQKDGRANGRTDGRTENRIMLHMKFKIHGCSGLREVI